MILPQYLFMHFVKRSFSKMTSDLTSFLNEEPFGSRMNKRLLETEIRTTLASGDLLVVFMVAVSILLSPPPSHFLGGFLVGGGSHRGSLPLPEPSSHMHSRPINSQSTFYCLPPSSGLVGTLPTTCGKPSLVTNTITAVSSGHSCQITPLDQAHLSVKGSCWSRSGRR